MPSARSHRPPARAVPEIVIGRNVQSPGGLPLQATSTKMHLVDFHYLSLDSASAAGDLRAGQPASLRPSWLRARPPPLR